MKTPLRQPSEQGAPCRICIGVQGFSPPDWAGTFYPPGLAQRAWLPFYARVLDTVEMNTTFYAIPSAATVHGWTQRVPPHFTFCAKMPRAITHEKLLQDVDEELYAFLDRMRLLGSKLGAVLIQLPASFTRRFEERVRAFLPLLPQDLPFAIEFRHHSWQDEWAFDLLREHNVAWCVNHWQDLPITIQATANFAYFRLVGFHDQFEYLGRVQRDRSRELSSLAETIAELALGLERIFVYVNNHYAGHAPTTVNQLKELLGLPTIDPRSLWPEQPQALPGLEL